jgi:aconitate hydratase
LVRNCDGRKISPQDISALAHWQASQPSTREIPFVVARVVLQDFTGVPLLVDLAAMRDAVAQAGQDPSLVEPCVPVDLVVDHSVQVDQAGSPQAFAFNIEREFQRNHERYTFLKWGQSAFKTVRIVPPGIGIVHQVNLEYLASVVFQECQQDPRDPAAGPKTLLYPDSLVGTDSHTTMINGLGVVGWGVGGIEAEAAMLGQPVYFQTPPVVGVHLHGLRKAGVTATDLTLHLTELLRKAKVVGQLVEFFGPGTRQLSVADRATIANMAPEYGATLAYFPVDEKVTEYLRLTGRSETHVALVEAYYRAQGLWGVPEAGQVDYTRVLELDLGSVEPCVAGPKRPQDRLELGSLKQCFAQALTSPVDQGGFGVTDLAQHPCPAATGTATPHTIASGLTHGSVVLAAITSCTNTSNPSVMMAAGLLAKKAVERGLRTPVYVKTSLAPGSRVVSSYLEQAGLQPYLDALGFHVVGFGCTTCIGNSGPLHPDIEDALQQKGYIACSVLSGNRNFEARVHGSIKANFLMSPPLVVAFALAGTVLKDLTQDPLGHDPQGQPVYLADLWPSDDEVAACVREHLSPAVFGAKYATVGQQDQWDQLPVATGQRYAWDSRSTYIQHPPFFQKTQALQLSSEVTFRPLLILGDSVTTDHISPAGSIKPNSPAGRYLAAQGVAAADFNSYGSRRGNDQVMVRGTFANIRLKNHMTPGVEGGVTRLMPSGELCSVYDAAMAYAQDGVPLMVLAGEDYGMGSSRDWAAKGTALLGVRVVIASSFERIHRSNLIGMGVLPLAFAAGISPRVLGLSGDETFRLKGLEHAWQPGQTLTLEIGRPSGTTDSVPVTVRIDTSIELDYYTKGGILPYVLNQLLEGTPPRQP